MRWGLVILGPVLLLGGCGEARPAPAVVPETSAEGSRELDLYLAWPELPGYAEAQQVLQVLASTRAPEDHTSRLTVRLRDGDGVPRQIAFSTCALGPSLNQRFHSLSLVLPPGTKAVAVATAEFSHGEGIATVEREIELPGR